ncbi:outer membrane protein assembly factor BamC [Bowmanella dokdonensis]|uniref:Outer membrane protein assembly factor BamC n=1 Tax=Bowmanella dokdonensis TaxID=751969 RepID=A0A939DKI0_9ALTE|nr:outer membrane protein assembly factor BamC [Bowmanella dokdonensis]MBN7824404.1 outer membrane protein assembly factor BamC [Bowmanella dokdonensis]
MYRFSLLTLMLATGLAGCSSSLERRTANGEFDYLQEQQRVNFKVPQGLNPPPESSEYQVPKIGQNAPANLVGQKLEVVSPALVLPLVTGSHVEEGQRSATIFFDQVDDSQPLDTAVWNSLLGYLEEQGIGVDSFDKQSGRLVTDWMLMETELDSGWFDWTTTERSIGRRFEFLLEMKPHGRTAALKVQLKDYLETVGEQVRSGEDLDAEARRRNEVDVLNKVIGHYESQIQIADARRVQQLRQGLEMQMGFNADGDPAFMVDGDYDMTWTRTQLVLRKLGFNVKDLDKSNGLLFVSYEGPDSSWWDRLWGSDKGLPMEREDYRLKLAKIGEKTSITLMDDESKPVSADLLTSIYPEFSQTMSASNLDI